MKVNRAVKKRLTPSRKELWSGLLVLGISALVVFTTFALWDGARNIQSLLLVLALLSAAVINPGIWIPHRWLPFLVAASLFALIWLSAATELLFLKLTVVDAVSVSVACWLIQMLARQVVALKNAIAVADQIVSETIIEPGDQFEPALHCELTRSRRYIRPFCLLTIQFDTPLQGLEKPDIRKLSETLDNSLRSTDQIYLGSTKDKLWLICPETNVVNITPLHARLRDRLAGNFPGVVSIGWAEFPADSLTAHELIAEAKRRLAQSEVQIPAENDTSEIAMLRSPKKSASA